jgi:hypothetical protein
MVKYMPVRQNLPFFALIAALTASLAACGTANKKIVSQDFGEGTVVDLSISEKVTGNQDFLLFSIPKKSGFLEGYIQGLVTDYKDNPVEGVVVRAVVSGQSQIEEGEENNSNFAVSSFDPGVSDTDGIYRIRFTLPIIDGFVDVRGKLLYNPGWEQQKEGLGTAYEPQTKESPFRLFYDRGRGQLVFSQGVRKTIVAPVGNPGAATAAALPGAKPPATVQKIGPSSPAAGEDGVDQDLFKGFGFGP